MVYNEFIVGGYYGTIHTPPHSDLTNFQTLATAMELGTCCQILLL